MRRALSLAALAALLLPASAFATIRAFRTPSGAIGCIYYRDPDTKAFLRCDVEGTGDRAWRVRGHGKARRIHVTDSARDPRSPVLAYGKTRTFGSMWCTSRMSGLTCKNRDGHGFKLSRQRQRLF
jgi:uncharacterized protein DUF6636